MQTLHLRFRDLRAILLGVPPSRWPTPSMRGASTWKGAPPLPNLPKPTCAVGLRPAVPVTLIGTGPESGAVPRVRQGQRAIRFHLSRRRDSLPDRACRALLFRQATVHPGDGLARQWQHDRPPVGVAACLPVCVLACLPGWSAGRMPICMSARLPVWQSACLPVWQSACLCPSPDR
jgi:hypothetical protein